MAKLDTRAIGLDAGLKFMTWLTGAENLHYGYWPGLPVSAGNFGAAQEAYTAKLFEQLPEGKLRILDIGGGAGVTAGKLLALGHEVEIIVPSPLLAERCRVNAPGAQVHEMGFEDYAGSGDFDLCLFSESFQYIPLERGLPRCLDLLKPDGQVLIADCFRSDAPVADRSVARVGGGHALTRFRQMLTELPVAVAFEEEITEAVAPSVDIEQELFNVVGFAATRVTQELAGKQPWRHRILTRLWRTFTTPRTRARLDMRLNQRTRTSEAFVTYNHYMIFRLTRV
ncbi:MAG: class I SAM-dependent methyltransferase [Pseudomonadota bacterium]